MSKNDLSGFSLVEVILSMALFALVVSVFMKAYLYSQETNILAQKRIRATYVAEEGIEAVRNIRDEDFANLIDGNYGIELNANQWNFVPGNDVTDIFTRSITISTIDPDTKLVQSTVDWSQNAQRDGQVILSTYMTRWETVANQDTFRSSEYYIGDGQFTGNSYTLNLNNSLSQNYFVLVQGSDGNTNATLSSNGNSGANNTTGPDENYIALVGDPWGTGDLNNIGPNDAVLEFERDNSLNSWVGTITVVECLNDCLDSGFELLDVQLVNHNGVTTSGSDTSAVSWSNIDQIMLMGGFNGSGCITSQTHPDNHKSCHVRIYPSGNDGIEWERDDPYINTATSTVMIINWGTEWNVQRINVSGNNGGNGINVVNEYDVGIITPVIRNNTWVWGTGYTVDKGIGDSADAVVITLGDGVSDSSSPVSTVAVGMEYTDQKNFEVYVLTHPDLQVDYIFKTDGDTREWQYDITGVDPATNAANRMSIIYNGSNGTGNAFPRSIWSSRYINNTTIRLERRRFGQNWPAWIQGIDFSAITN